MKLQPLVKFRSFITFYFIAFAVLLLPLLLLHQISILITLFIFSGVLFFIPTLIPNTQAFGPVNTRFKTTRREIWLTIDDGPNPIDTRSILKILDHYKAKATFFVIGEKATQFPELIQEIIDRGHSLGNHTNSHPVGSFWIAFPSRLKREIDQCQETLSSYGHTPLLFRAPVGMINYFLPPLLAQRNLLAIGWSSRGFDTLPSDPQTILDRLWKSVTPGAILLLHQGYHPINSNETMNSRTLELLLKKMQSENYTCILPKQQQLTRLIA